MYNLSPKLNYIDGSKDSAKSMNQIIYYHSETNEPENKINIESILVLVTYKKYMSCMTGNIQFANQLGKQNGK